MCVAEFTNHETQMTAEVFYVSAPFRTNADRRYKVFLTDLESESVVTVRWFASLESAETFARDLVFPSSRLISSPTFLPEVR